MKTNIAMTLNCVALGVLCLATSALAEPTLAELDQKVKALERKLELANEAATSKAKEAPAVSASLKDGFSLQSADKTIQLKLRGLIQSDARFFLSDDEDKAADTFAIRRLRPILEGSLGPQLGFRFTPDFAGSQTVLLDAFMDLKFDALSNLRVGKFKPQVGLERLQTDSDMAFAEYGFPSLLAPNRDIGIQFFGSVNTGLVDYAIGIFNGVPDSGIADTDSNDAKDLVARVYFAPFRDSGSPFLGGLTFGVAGSIGNPEGTTNAPGLPSLKNVGQQSFFSYRVNATNPALTAVADGNHVRIAPQFYYSAGPFGLLGEYTISKQDVRNDAGSDALENKAWNLTASYVLTGEDAGYKGITPRHPWDPAHHQWGAAELVARVTALDIDDQAFAGGYADAQRVPSQAQDRGVGINWFLSRNVRFSVDYNQIQYEGGAAAGDRPDDKIVISRLQYAF